MNTIFDSFTKFPFIFGGAALSGTSGGYGFGEFEEGLLDYCFDRGVRVFDTAPIYGFGASEEVLGSFIESKREECFIISKCGVDWHDNQRVNMSNDKKTTEKMLISSLKRMNTEYIDHYMVHWPDENTDIRYTLEVLEKAVSQQKIGSIGLCNTTIDELEKASEVAPIRSVQLQNNIFEAPPSDLSTYLEEKNIPLVSWGVFDKGILTGRVDQKREKSKNYEAGDSRRKSVWWKQTDVLKKIEKVEKFSELVKQADVSLVELALSYSLEKTCSTHLLMGAKSIKDWEHLLAANYKGVSSDLLREVEKICQE